MTTYGSRSRSRIFGGATETWEYTKYNPWDETTSTVNGTYVPSIANDSMNDVVTQSFERTRNNGGIVNSPMVSDSVLTVTPLFYFDHGLSSISPYEQWLTYEGTIVDPYFTDVVLEFIDLDKTSDIEDLTALASTKALANRNLDVASSLVSVGEGKQTVTGVYDICRRAVKIARAAKKFQWRVLRKELSPSELADRWMEIRYGIRPLYYDICQITDAYKASVSLSGRNSRHTARGHYSQVWSNTDNSPFTSLSTRDYNRSRTVKVEADVRAGILSQVERFSVAEVWGLTSIPEAILDLTTLSFVLGWFFNTADFISALNPSYNLKALAEWTVVKTTKTQTAKVISSSAKDPQGSTHYQGDEHSDMKIRKQVTVTRSPLVNYSATPTFNLRLDWQKCIDLVIIGRNLVSTLRGKRKFIPR